MTESVKTKPPINCILSLLLAALFITLSISNIVWALYGPLIWLCFYVFFCRYCCIVTITTTDFQVKYLAPWKKAINIAVPDIAAIDYAKGYYDWAAKKTISSISTNSVDNILFPSIGRTMFPQFPYDRLIIDLKNADEEIYININTRMFDFDKILAWAATSKQLKS